MLDFDVAWVTPKHLTELVHEALAISLDIKCTLTKRRVCHLSLFCFHHIFSFFNPILSVISNHGPSRHCARKNRSAPELREIPFTFLRLLPFLVLTFCAHNL